MGKGQIVNDFGDGRYAVKLLQNREKADQALARIDTWIALNQTRQDALPPGDPEHKLPMLKLSMASLLKQKEYLLLIPADETIDAWCADRTEELSGVVGTIEINGDPNATVNIRPGYTDNAAHVPARDGQEMNIRAMTPEQAFYNLAMMPGWQKWKPTYRVGAITSIDGDTCSVMLDDANSSIKGAEYNINQAWDLTDVDIEYMNCNGSAFESGDRVIVQFIGQDFETPKVIGFEDNPKPCSQYVLIYSRVGIKQVTIIWDCSENYYAANGYWVDSSDIKHIISPSDYPFISDIDDDVFSLWQSKTVKDSSNMYSFGSRPPYIYTVETIPTPPQTLSVTSPMGNVFIGYLHTYFDKTITVTGSKKTEYGMEFDFLVDPPYEEYREFINVGNCFREIWTPYDPYPISSNMDGEWLDIYIDTELEPRPCPHRASTWNATILVTQNSVQVEKITTSYENQYNYVDESQWSQDGTLIKEIRLDFYHDKTTYYNGGYRSGELSQVPTPNGKDREVGHTTTEYIKDANENPLGNTQWSYKVYTELNRPGSISGYLNLIPAGPPWAEGDCSCFSICSFYEFNDDYAVQVYIDRKHGSNTFAQCVKRETATSSFTAQRNTEFESAIKAMVTLAHEQVTTATELWKVQVPINVVGILKYLSKGIIK